MSLTGRLASACEEVRYEGLSSRTRELTELVILDTLGAMLSASRIGSATRVWQRFASDGGGNGTVPVVGLPIRTDAVTAALANGYLAYAMDIESHHGPSIVHAAAAVVPAVLAAASLFNSSGRKLTCATAVGIEVATRVSLAIGPNDLYARGFHPTAVAGVFGATVACAKLQNLDAPAIRRALGLAATQAAGLLSWANDPSEQSRPFTAALAARNGITAALLAAYGLSASEDTFDPDSKYSAFRAWSLDGRGRPEHLEPWGHDCPSIAELTIKQHGCCGFLHPSVDLLLSMTREQSLNASDIESIDLRFPAKGAPMIDGNPLRSHRAQYILPLAAIRGYVDFDNVLKSQEGDPELRRLALRTRVIHDSELDSDYPAHYASRLTLITQQGRSLSDYCRDARGTPQNPMSDIEVQEKFLRLATSRVGLKASETIRNTVLKLESLDDAGTLLLLLQPTTVVEDFVAGESSVEPEPSIGDISGHQGPAITSSQGPA